MNTYLKSSINSNIKKYRKLNGFTQEKFAELLGLGTQYYAQLERGERNFPLDKIIKACEIFNIGIEDIIEINKSNNNSNVSELKESIILSLNQLSQNQLIATKNFITNITPFIK